MKRSNFLTPAGLVVILLTTNLCKESTQLNETYEEKKDTIREENKYDYLFIDLGDYENVPSQEEFEYSEFWRKEAFKASSKFIENEINKKPNCTLIKQGHYQPYLIRYLGGFGFLTKHYCEFDCKQGYNNPSNFWVEVYYRGYNNWSAQIIKQKFVD
ncbi:hypothetical protein [uncultured Winogradskyella sp.]|uniref:hypothetical protein n=1 Tax=uncultured Winogradskyella sp. TaxID=395353 RepID=UPI002624004D|nr:hypothetical protein [uncultured Winogradskyella sp.]